MPSSQTFIAELATSIMMKMLSQTDKRLAHSFQGADRHLDPKTVGSKKALKRLIALLHAASNENSLVASFPSK
jgi:hypothetical protein